MINNYTSLGGFPDPDLCIRTGGERRLSNFLLWHFAYTKFYFTDCFWPDFNKSELQLALDDYAHRQRRFGGQNKAFRLGNQSAVRAYKDCPGSSCCFHFN